MILFVLLFSSVVNASEWPAADFRDCSFYKKAEEILKCSSQGYDYLTNYGFHYCEEFKRESAGWSEKAKSWTNDTGQCLQEMLRDNKSKRISPCSQLEEFAFDVHPICYKQYRICGLDLMDKYRIVSTVRAVDLFTRKSLMQSLNVFFSCIADLISKEEGATATRIVALTKDYSKEDRRMASVVFSQAPIESQVQRRNYFRRSLGLLLAESRQQVSAKVIEIYKSEYGTAEAIGNQDTEFFDCGKNVALGKGSKNCDNALAKEFKTISPKEARAISGKISPEEMKLVIKELGRWREMK